MKPFPPRRPAPSAALPLAFAFCVAQAIAATPPSIFRSGPAAVHLLELYTSEGCNSCPPAERWFSSLAGDPRLWREFVPVAFHVTYWDYLGWRDPFGSPDHDDRQRAHADAWRARTIYTPCFVRDGLEWRRDAAPPVSSSGEAGVLVLELAGDNSVTLRFTPAASGTRSRYTASLALLAGGAVSKVTSGENAGLELGHEFAALHVDTRPLAADPAEPGACLATFAAPPAPAPAVPRPSRLALAAWVSPAGSSVPVQAVGGWLP